MTGPKHLWSGDWENESADTSAQRVPPPRPREPEAAPPERPRSRRQVRPWVLPLAIGAIVIVAAAFGLTKVFGGSSKHTPANTPTVSTLPSPQLTPNTQGTPNARPIIWLGMEITSVAPGVTVVETVRPNSNGDLAGLEPGDVLLGVNNHSVGSPAAVTSAIKGLHTGDHVTLEVNNGGAVLQLVATLAAPPTPYP